MVLTRTSVALASGALAVALTAGSVAAATTPAPTPTITSVTAQLDSLGRQSEQLAEKYNAATIALAKVRGDLQGAQRDLAAATARRDLAQNEFVRLVQAQYESGPANAFGSLMTSNSRQSYMDEQNYSDLAASHAAGVISAYRDATAKADKARLAEVALVLRARAQVRSLAADRAAVTSRSATLTSLLATLTAAQQRAYAAREAANRAQLAAITAKTNATAPTSSTSPAAQTKQTKQTKTKHKKSTPAPSRYTVHAGNAAAQRAVDFALAQVGKPYQWGAAGPGSYDCSGLTMAAWRRGGVNLPHEASAQYHYGHHVGWDELQPGDLIFLYHPIGHAEIYIGHGLAVSAPTTGQDVKIISIDYDRSSFAGATRLT